MLPLRGDPSTPLHSPRAASLNITAAMVDTADESPFSISSAASFAAALPVPAWGLLTLLRDFWHGKLALFNIALPWVMLCQEFFRSF